MPADQFAALFGTGEVSINVQLPSPDASVPAAWNLQGQTVSVAFNVNSSVKQLKEALSAQLGGMPASKQQLKASTPGLGECFLFISHLFICSFASKDLFIHHFCLILRLLALTHSVFSSSLLDSIQIQVSSRMPVLWRS